MGLNCSLAWKPCQPVTRRRLSPLTQAQRLGAGPGSWPLPTPGPRQRGRNEVSLEGLHPSDPGRWSSPSVSTSLCRPVQLPREEAGVCVCVGDGSHCPKSRHRHSGGWTSPVGPWPRSSLSTSNSLQGPIPLHLCYRLCGSTATCHRNPQMASPHSGVGQVSWPPCCFLQTTPHPVSAPRSSIINYSCSRGTQPHSSFLPARAAVHDKKIKSPGSALALQGPRNGLEKERPLSPSGEDWASVLHWETVKPLDMPSLSSHHQTHLAAPTWSSFPGPTEPQATAPLQPGCVPTTPLSGLRIIPRSLFCLIFPLVTFPP